MNLYPEVDFEAKITKGRGTVVRLDTEENGMTEENGQELIESQMYEDETEVKEKLQDVDELSPSRSRSNEDGESEDTGRLD